MADHPQFTDDIIHDVGLVVIRWNLVKMYAQFIAGHILGVSIETSNILFNSSSVPFQAEVLSAIVQERVGDPALAKKLISEAKKMKDLSNFRNLIVHGRWVSDEAGGPLTFVLKKDGQRMLAKADLSAKSIQIRELAERLQHLFLQLRNESFSAGPPSGTPHRVTTPTD